MTSLIAGSAPNPSNALAWKSTSIDPIFQSRVSSQLVTDWLTTYWLTTDWVTDHWHYETYKGGYFFKNAARGCVTFSLKNIFMGSIR